MWESHPGKVARCRPEIHFPRGRALSGGIYEASFQTFACSSSVDPDSCRSHPRGPQPGIRVVPDGGRRFPMEQPSACSHSGLAHQQQQPSHRGRKRCRAVMKNPREKKTTKENLMTTISARSEQLLSRQRAELNHNITTLKKEKVMSHNTFAAANPAAARPASTAALRVLAACLMFLVFSHLPAYADHIHHLWYNNSTWQDQDLTALTGGGIATSFGGIAAFDTTPNHQLHVYYVDNNAQHLHQLYYNGKSWSDADLTSYTGGPTASPYGISAFAVDNPQYIFYIGTDSHVHETYYNNYDWTDQDLTSITGGPSAGFGPVLAFDTKPNLDAHVYYQDQNLDLHQIYFNGSSWSDSDLTVSTGALCYTSWLAGFAVNNTQHVFCPGYGKYSNNLDMLHIYYNNYTWVYQDVTFLSGGSETPMYLGSGVAAFKVPKANQFEVYSVTDDTHFNRYYHVVKPGQWIDRDLTSSIGAPTDAQYGG